MSNNYTVKDKVRDTLIRASTVYSKSHKNAVNRYLIQEINSQAIWVLNKIAENAEIAEANKLPLCDDTGIPHLFLEIGRERLLSGELISEIQHGVILGLRELPGRPMAVKGDEVGRLEQVYGLDEDPGALSMAPLFIQLVDEDVLRLHILMQGGGPEIRGKTYRIFHQHSLSAIIDEIVKWSLEGAAQLGCTPCTPAIGIGRTHYEATTLMLQAMAHGDFAIQNNIEQKITERLNKSGIGPLGLKGNTTALATFLKVGPQRASGVRIVCLRLCCIVEPRVASILL